MSMNVDYNTFVMLEDNEQLEVAQGAIHKCTLFNRVS
jgi:hypothetical protein